MIDKIVNLISGRSITDISRHETGGLGVDCVIDNGGKCIYICISVFDAWAKLAQQWLVCAPLEIHFEPIINQFSV